MSDYRTADGLDIFEFAEEAHFNLDNVEQRNRDGVWNACVKGILNLDALLASLARYPESMLHDFRIKPQEPDKEKVPEWFEVGRMVSWDGMSRGVVIAINGDIAVIGSGGGTRHWRQLTPLRLRPYTYDELVVETEKRSPMVRHIGGATVYGIIEFDGNTLYYGKQGRVLLRESFGSLVWGDGDAFGVWEVDDTWKR